MSIEVEQTIRVKVGGNEFELTEAEAKELFQALKATLYKELERDTDWEDALKKAFLPPVEPPPSIPWGRDDVPYFPSYPPGIDIWC